MVDLLEADKIAGVGFQEFLHQGLTVVPGMGTVFGQAEPKIHRHDGDRAIGPVFVLFRDGYGGNFCHRDIVRYSLPAVNIRRTADKCKFFSIPFLAEQILLRTLIGQGCGRLGAAAGCRFRIRLERAKLSNRSTICSLRQDR